VASEPSARKCTAKALARTASAQWSGILKPVAERPYKSVGKILEKTGS
jgi:hypothetical protein